MLLYSLLHLTGHQISLDDIRNFRQWGSKTPGHPEICIDCGIETTTGPLGQGFATARRDRRLHRRVVNIDGYEVSGVDVQFDWVVAAGGGALGLHALQSWMDRFEVIPPPGLPRRDKVGRVGWDKAGFAILDLGGSRPEWKGLVEVGYARGPVNLGLRWRYVDRMRDSDPAVNYRVPSHDYLDLHFAYAFSVGSLDGLVLRAGVENLADLDPPLLPSGVNANTDASQYDVLGRRYFVSLRYGF